MEIKKRVGPETFDSLTTELIQSVTCKKDQHHNKNNEKDDDEAPANKGKMKADATVADQYITYPTDNGLLNQSRKQCEKFI